MNLKDGKWKTASKSKCIHSKTAVLSKHRQACSITELVCLLEVFFKLQKGDSRNSCKWEDKLQTTAVQHPSLCLKAPYYNKITIFSKKGTGWCLNATRERRAGPCISPKENLPACKCLLHSNFQLRLCTMGSCAGNLIKDIDFNKDKGMQRRLCTRPFNLRPGLVFQHLSQALVLEL